MGIVKRFPGIGIFETTLLDYRYMYQRMSNRPQFSFLGVLLFLLFHHALMTFSLQYPILSRRDALLTGMSGTLMLSPQLEQRLTNFAKAFENKRPDSMLLRTNEPADPSNPYKGKLQMPTVGYSFYKTKDNVDECLRIALFNEVAMIDVATQYGTNDAIGQILRDLGITGGNVPTKGMRNLVFFHHKISNSDQSASIKEVKQNVRREMRKLGLDGKKSFLDLVSIHSPLTDKERRLTSYRALLELQEEGIIKAVGVCNYGVGALNEIIEAGMPAPAINQLELSPFNQHKDVVAWALKHDMKLSCAAWSKLSSVNGPQKEWDILAGIAKQKSATKAQILVLWALQMGYNCVPRSGAGSKLEKLAILENSYKGVNRIEALTEEELDILNGLDVGLTAGHLGRRDGWDDDDVSGDDWDPTNFVK